MSVSNGATSFSLEVTRNIVRKIFKWNSFAVAEKIVRQSDTHQVHSKADVLQVGKGAEFRVMNYTFEFITFEIRQKMMNSYIFFM